MTENKNHKHALFTLTTVFFFWGFIAAGNSIFLGFCKEYFNLDQFQSQLIEFAFYGAYFIGAMILFISSSISRTDIMNRWGLKNGIIYGENALRDKKGTRQSARHVKIEPITFISNVPDQENNKRIDKYFWEDRKNTRSDSCGMAGYWIEMVFDFNIYVFKSRIDYDVFYAFVLGTLHAC